MICQPLRILNSGEEHGIGATSLLLNNEVVLDYGAQFEEYKTPDGYDVRYQLAPDCNRYRNKRLAGVLISHDHLDHLGALPQLMIDEHDGVPVYISPEADQGAEIMLKDTLKIARYAAKDAEETGRSVPPALFTELELEKLSAALVRTNPGEWFTLGRENEYHCGRWPIGHNRGAQCTAIITPDGWPVFWTGDASAHDVQVANGVMLPDDWEFQKFMAMRNKVMITEATNGARPSPGSREELKKRIIAKANEVLRRGGSILSSTFANQRAGSLLIILREAMEAGLLPEVPIHIDGLARYMVILQVPEAGRWSDEGKVIFIPPDSRHAQPGKAHRELMSKGMDPCGHEQTIVISSSADMRQGPSVFHASYMAGDPKNAIFFPGYLFPGSPAKEIYANRLQKGYTIQMDVWKEKKTVNIRADVEHFELSAHDWQEALIERVRLFSPAHLVVHHCPAGDFAAFQQALLDALPNPPAVYHAGHKKEIVIQYN